MAWCFCFFFCFVFFQKKSMFWRRHPLIFNWNHSHSWKMILPIVTRLPSWKQYFCAFLGDSVLPGVEWQSENSSLHLHPGEIELSHHRDQLQTVCAAGGRRRTDLSAQQHTGGGTFAVIHMPTAQHADMLFIGYWLRKLQKTTWTHTDHGQDTVA